MTANPAEGVPLYCLGDSWYGADICNTGPTTRAINRLHRRVGSSSLLNRAVAGYSVGDMLQAAIAPSAQAWPTNSKGLVVMPMSMNELFYNGAMSNADFEATAEMNLRGLVAVLSAGNRREDSSGATFTYSGVWTTISQPNASGGTVRYCTANNSWVEFTPNQPTTTIVTSCLKTPVYNNMRITATQSGVQVGSWDMQNKYVGGGFGTDSQGKAMLLKGLTPGVPVRLTYTTMGRSSAYGYFDSVMETSSRPPTILVVKPMAISSATYPQYGDTARISALRSLVDAVVADTAHVFSADPLPGWQPATMLGADGVHPSDAGHAHLADILEAALAELPYRAGMHV